MALNNSQHQAIMREYDVRRARNRDVLNARYAEVYTKIPEIEVINQSVSTLSIQKAKQLLFDSDVSISSLDKEFRLLTTKREDLLTQSGYPADYLAPIHDCTKCHDTGYIDTKKCSCFQRAVVELFYTQSNLTEIFDRENFKAFSLDYYSKNFIDPISSLSARTLAESTLNICKSFVYHFATDNQSLLITGGTGLGKTFLSNCIARELIENSYSVIYFTASEFFELCAQHTFGQTSRADLMDFQLTSCDLLIIDDLGTELQNSFTNSQLFIYINDRILKKKSTLISTNLSLSDLRTIYGERIFSRINSSYTTIRLAGDDIREQKKLMK